MSNILRIPWSALDTWDTMSYPCLRHNVPGLEKGSIDHGQDAP